MVSNSKSVGERAQHLLRVLVERYIQDGQPVGSRTLARDGGLDLSPATIRNVMADLEEFGLVSSPHTSAGRVPTVQGYRLFVDSLLTIQPLESTEVEHLRAGLGEAEDDPKQVVQSASQLLSALTSMAGVVMVPLREHTAFRHVEFLPLSNRRVLAIMVTNEREVHNRILQTRRQHSAAELREASNYLDQAFAGKEVEEIRSQILREMQDTRRHLNQLMVDAIDMAHDVFQDTGDDYIIAGQTNLMEFADLSDVERLRQLFEAFNRKRDILELLDHCLQARGVRIFIGDESGHAVLDDCSVVTAPYSVDGEVVGVLGVIGPTRMDYQRVIPIVDVTAKLLGAALNPR